MLRRPVLQAPCRPAVHPASGQRACHSPNVEAVLARVEPGGPVLCCHSIDAQSTIPWHTYPVAGGLFGGVPALCHTMTRTAATNLWPPGMNESTISMPCDYEGYVSEMPGWTETTGKFSVVDIDWSNNKAVWVNTPGADGRGMTCEEDMVAQVEKIKAADPTTSVWVYRNIVNGAPEHNTTHTRPPPPPPHPLLHMYTSVSSPCLLMAASVATTVTAFNFAVTALMYLSALSSTRPQCHSRLRTAAIAAYPWMTSIRKILDQPAYEVTTAPAPAAPCHCSCHCFVPRLTNCSCTQNRLNRRLTVTLGCVWPQVWFLHFKNGPDGRGPLAPMPITLYFAGTLSSHHSFPSSRLASLLMSPPLASNLLSSPHCRCQLLTLLLDLHASMR